MKRLFVMAAAMMLSAPALAHHSFGVNFEVLIEDPKVLTKPYTQRATLMLREKTRLREYSCAENNMDPKVCEKLLADPTLFLRSPEQGAGR